MIFFIRTKDDKTVVDVELIMSRRDNLIDITTYINIEEYSKLLLGADESTQHEIIQRFDAINQLRGWLFEVFLPAYKYANLRDTFNAATANVRKGMVDICDKLNLQLVED